MVFPDRPLGPFATKTRLHLRPHPEGWELTQERLILGDKKLLLPSDSHDLKMLDAILVNRIEIEGAQTAQLFFSKRYARNLEKLSHLLGVQLPKPHSQINTTIHPPASNRWLNLP